YGWGYWAGTSFATPIISAIAASVWSAEPGIDPPEVIKRVVGFNSGAAQLGCPVIETRQEP
ncbi:MAG: S8 family serine peptidase, partial [Chloroflexota bacterium]